MTVLEEQQLKKRVADLESRVARLEGLLLREGVQIGVTEHGDVVFSVAAKANGGPTTMGAALLSGQ